MYSSVKKIQIKNTLPTIVIPYITIKWLISKNITKCKHKRYSNTQKTTFQYPEDNRTESLFHNTPISSSETFVWLTFILGQLTKWHLQSNHFLSKTFCTKEENKQKKFCIAKLYAYSHLRKKMIFPSDSQINLQL